MGWRLLQNCSKRRNAGGTDAIFSVTSVNVTIELKQHVTAFAYFCTKKPQPKPPKNPNQQNDNVPLQRSREKGEKWSWSLLIHFPTNERTMIKLRMNKAVPHLQSWVNAKHSRHLVTVLINKLNDLAGLSQAYLLRQSRNPYLTHFLNDSFLNQERD